MQERPEPPKQPAGFVPSPPPIVLPVERRQRPKQPRVGFQPVAQKTK